MARSSGSVTGNTDRFFGSFEALLDNHKTIIECVNLYINNEINSP